VWYNVHMHPNQAQAVAQAQTQSSTDGIGGSNYPEPELWLGRTDCITDSKLAKDASERAWISVDNGSLHAGCRVRKGVKWAANLWVNWEVQ
jgi:hypothetical protein